MSHKEVFVLLHEYAAGALSDDEIRLVDSHLATGCPECEAELREINEALVLLAEAGGLIDPPERLKESVLSRVLEEPQTVPVRISQEVRESSGTRWSLNRSAAGLAIAASLALAVLGVPWLVRQPGPPSEDDAAATVQDRRGPEVQFVSLSVPPAERNWLKHVLFDSLSGQLHVWVLTRGTEGEVVPAQVELIDKSGTLVIAVSLETGDGVAGAVIAAPNLPTVGTLVVRSGPVGGNGTILESCDFELRR